MTVRMRVMYDTASGNVSMKLAALSFGQAYSMVIRRAQELNARRWSFVMPGWQAKTARIIEQDERKS